MANRYQVIVGGIDVADNLIEKPSLILNKGELGQLVPIPEISLLMDNSKRSFTPGGPSSIFSTDFRGDPIAIYEDGILIYEGEIRNVHTESVGIRAVIDASSKVNRLLGYQVPGFITEVKTLAELSQDLYALYGIETDPISYGQAQAQQELLLLQVRGNVRITSEATLSDLQTWLTNVGLCRHYFIGSIAYMDFELVDGLPGIVAEFTDDDILDISDYSLIETDPYNGYEIITASGTALKSGNNQVPTLNGFVDQNFIISTPEFGYNWGDYQIALSERELYRIAVQFRKGEYTSWLTLNSTFGINSQQTGIIKEFKVLSIDNTSLLGPKITGQSIN